MANETHILILDDDPDLKNTLQDILKAKGYAVKTAATGKTALKRIQEKSPDVALLDIKLDDISGLELLRQLKVHSPTTEVILITGSASMESTIEANILGAYCYVQKPYEINQLLLIISGAAEKKKTLEALRESEEKYRLIFNNAVVSIYQTTPEGQFISANPMLANMLGYDSPEELIESTSNIQTQFYVHPEQRRDFKRLLEQGEVRDFEWQAYRKDGSIAWLSENARAVKDENGKVIYYEGTCQDITERKRVEEELRVSESRLKSAEKIAKLGHWELDLQENVLFWSDEIFRIFEIDPSQFKASYEAFLDLVHPDDRERVNMTYTKSVKNRTPYSKYHRLAFKDGRIKFVHENCETYYDEDGNALRSLGTVHDITERKRLEEALRDAETRYQTIADFTYDWEYWELDDGTMGYVSPACERITGYAADRFLEDPQFLHEIIVPEDREDWARHSHQAGEAMVQREIQFRIRRRDGETRWIEHTCQVVEDDGVFMGFRASNRDITNRKRAEDQVRKHSAVLEAINKVFLETLTRETDEEVAATCLKVAEELTDSRFGLIGELNPVGLFDTIAISNPGWDACKMPDSEATRLIKNMEIRGIDRSTLREGQTRIVNEPASHPDLVGTPEGHPPITSFLGVPLKQAGKTIGLIGLGNKESGYSQDDQEAIEALSVAFIEALMRKRAEQALRKNEKLYRALFEHSNDAIFLLGGDGVHISANLKAAKLLGYDREELIGMTTKDIVAPREYPDAKSKLDVLLSGQSLPLYERVFHTKDGFDIPVEINATLIKDSRGDATYIQSIARNITKRKQAEERIQQQVQRLTALRTIDQAIIGSIDLHLTLDILLKEITEQLGIDAACVLLYNPNMQSLEYANGCGFRTSALQYTNLRLGEGYAGKVALERRSIHIDNIVEDENGLKSAPLLADERFVTYYGVPLIAKGKIKGVLEIFHRASLDVTSEWLEFLDMLAGQAAIAIENTELFDNLQKANFELTLAYDNTLEGWSRALELRDMETMGHSQRVTDMTMRLARALDVSENKLIHIRRGALLHDIGKMGIPDSILHKQGKLTDEEWEIMRKHPVYAQRFLSQIDYLRPALEIPYCHHEKWDGTGYPQGLSGEQIPLAARIFAVVDVWDALNSDRPYREAWSQEKVLNYIQEQAGKHFDLQVVEKFFNLLS